MIYRNIEKLHESVRDAMREPGNGRLAVRHAVVVQQHFNVFRPTLRQEISGLPESLAATL